LVDQATALAGREPDVVALQEITPRTLALWRRAFELMGLAYVRASAAGDGAGGRAARRRTLVMIGSRVALEDSEPLGVPWPESALSMLARTPSGPVEIHCVHVPNAANGWVKVETLRALRRRLETPARVPRVLCGDLNTPRRELPNGKTISFARDSRGRLRPDRGTHWDAAELGVVPGLREVGYRDAYRTLHGYRSRSPSWTWKAIAGHDGGWRLDHIFISAPLAADACQYHHDWREQGLSDHSALEADFEYGDARAAAGTPSPRFERKAAPGADRRPGEPAAADVRARRAEPTTQAGPNRCAGPI
jgi:exonuclease III